MATAVIRRPSTLARPRRRAGYHKDVATHLVRLELATRHRGSVLGWLWSLVPPLLQLAATYFLFTKIIPLDIPNYPIFLLSGILAWSWFARSLGGATSSLETRRDLVMRPGFPTALLPFTDVSVGLVDYFIGLPILLIALGVTTGLYVEILILPALLVIQFLLIAGIGFFLAPLQVHFRDVRQIVAIAISVGFWLTPVFYRRVQVPPEFAFLYDINPMAQLIEAQRRPLPRGLDPERLGSDLGRHRVRGSLRARLRVLRRCASLPFRSSCERRRRQYRGSLEAVHTQGAAAEHAQAVVRPSSLADAAGSLLGAAGHQPRDPAGRDARTHRRERLGEVDSAPTVAAGS